MSRTVTAGMQSELGASSIEPVYLMYGAFGSGDVRLWTGYGDLTWGADTFTGAGTLIAISDIVESAGGEVTGITLTLSGVDPDTLSLAMDEHYQSRALQVWLGAISSGALVADPILVFDGLMDVMPINDDPDSPSISLTGETRLLGASHGRTWRYTSEDQKALYPTDQGFEFVEQLPAQNFVWGRS